MKSDLIEGQYEIYSEIVTYIQDTMSLNMALWLLSGRLLDIYKCREIPVQAQ